MGFRMERPYAEDELPGNSPVEYQIRGDGLTDGAY
jgi:hypothetical protein